MVSSCQTGLNAAEATVSGLISASASALCRLPHLCISDADVLMPRHSSRMVPATATNNKNLVRVRKDHTALDGGSEALAAFQVMPPLGSSMASSSGGPQHHPGTLDY